VKRLLGFKSCLVGSALVALAAHAAHATSTTITGVQVSPTETGVRITLATDETGNTPQVFAINQGNSLRADIVRTELKLQNESQFTQRNPAPGIDAIALVPLDAHSVRLTVDGSNQAPISSVTESANGDIVIDVNTASTATPASTPVPSELVTVPGEAPQLAQAQPQPDPPAETGPAQTTDQPDVLVPNPEVVIDGIPVTTPQELQVAPPFLPRAVAPPVGDIAVSELQLQLGGVDLGTAERVPRLVLRNAPSREVLSLLARAAGLNLVFIDPTGGEGPLVTLDIQNESVQDAFNSVLRITGLQANRVGRTIYVGTDLPAEAQNLSVRSVRLNQVSVGEAVNFLVALGAESAVSRERLVTSVNAVEVADGAPPITETQTTTEQRVEQQRVDYQDATPIFRGLQVVGEERTNSLTLVGSPQLIELATQQLVRLDLRRRQVAINVRVIDVDLNAVNAFGTSFSFSIGNSNFVSNGGVGIVNFGNNAPFTGSNAAGGVFGAPGAAPIAPAVTVGGNGFFNVGDNFLIQLIATVQNGSGKILTDPTLVVQEGQTATVALTQDVVTEITETTTNVAGGGVVTAREFTVEPAGLILQIDVDRVDDNGFVSFSVAPSISAPGGTFDTGNGIFTLLAERQLSSGLVRVRDGQTLLLSGIIQESERSSVSKIPILGDIPLLGSLFRTTVNTNERNEVIVLLTPEILSDSDESVWGYSYTPSEEIQDLIDRSPEPGQ
jgi:type IV pilus assembly protein PilQ